MEFLTAGNKATRQRCGTILAPQVVIALLTSIALTGCRYAGMVVDKGDRANGSATTQPATLPPEVAADSAALTEYIGNQAFVTEDAGYRAIYALWKGESNSGSFDAVAAELRSAHVIGRSWHDDPQRLLTRARAAYMVCRATKIQSGLNWQLFGCGRYAWHELIYRDIAQPGSEMNLISGGEFLGIISRADEYVAKAHHAPPPNLDLGPRPH